jgi:hypothetical protein
VIAQPGHASPDRSDQVQRDQRDADYEVNFRHLLKSA